MIRNRKDAEKFVEDIEKGISKYTYINGDGNEQVMSAALTESICSMPGARVEIIYDSRNNLFTSYNHGKNWSDQCPEEMDREDVIDLIYENRENYNIFF